MRGSLSEPCPAQTSSTADANAKVNVIFTAFSGDASEKPSSTGTALPMLFEAAVRLAALILCVLNILHITVSSASYADARLYAFDLTAYAAAAALLFLSLPFSLLCALSRGRRSLSRIAAERTFASISAFVFSVCPLAADAFMLVTTGYWHFPIAAACLWLLSAVFALLAAMYFCRTLHRGETSASLRRKTDAFFIVSLAFALAGSAVNLADRILCHLTLPFGDLCDWMLTFVWPLLLAAQRLIFRAVCRKPGAEE